MPTHTNSWSNTAPLDADDINQGAAEMRKFRLDVDERMDIDHDWPASTDGGYHTAVHLKEQAGDPAAVANVGAVYTKDVSGVSMPYYIDSAGAVYPIITTKEPEQYITELAGGFWGDVIWSSATDVIIRPKSKDGCTAFIGAVLNDGTFLKLTTDYTIQLTHAGGSADGITSHLNNEFYVIWAYETVGGTLGFCLTWMPKTTFSTNNPTSTLTLNQVNSQNIGLLFNPNANLLVWNSSAKFETLLYNTAAAAYTPTGACYLASRTDTVLTLDGNLAVANFSANDYVVQLDGFKPLAVDDGLIIDIIGTRGYKDTGIRIRTDGSGAILTFSIIGDKLYYNGAGSDTYGFSDPGSVSASYAVYRLSYVPCDKTPISRAHGTNTDMLLKMYYATYGFTISRSTTYDYHNVIIDAMSVHGLLCVAYGEWYIMGYSI